MKFNLVGYWEEVFTPAKPTGKCGNTLTSSALTRPKVEEVLSKRTYVKRLPV